MFNAEPLTFDYVVWMHCFSRIEFYNPGTNPPWVTARRVNDLPAETIRLIGEQLLSAPAGKRGARASMDVAWDILPRLHPELIEPSSEPWLSEPPATYVHNRAIFASTDDLDPVLWELLFEAMVLRAGVSPWTAAERLSAIRRPVVDVLMHVFLDDSAERRGRAAYVATAEEWMQRLQMDLLLPSEEEWASSRRGSMR
jgi:hypothetical protein